MSLDEDVPDPLTSIELHRVLYERQLFAAIEAQDDRARRASQWDLIRLVQVPDEWMDHLLELYLEARRHDEGARQAKPGQQATEIALLKTHVPVTALIRAAFRAGMYEALYPGDKPS